MFIRVLYFAEFHKKKLFKTNLVVLSGKKNLTYNPKTEDSNRHEVRKMMAKKLYKIGQRVFDIFMSYKKIREK
jgi:hypothetical protein